FVHAYRERLRLHHDLPGDTIGHQASCEGVDDGEFQERGEHEGQTSGHPHIYGFDVRHLATHLGERGDRDGLHVGHGEHGEDPQRDPGRHGAHVQAERDPGEHHDQGGRDVQLDHVEPHAAVQLQVN
ncbi:hypothetical protein EGW08_017937, partial [Elysia chlorotica]